MPLLSVEHIQSSKSENYNTLQHIIHCEKNAVMYCMIRHFSFDDKICPTDKRCICKKSIIKDQSCFFAYELLFNSKKKVALIRVDLKM